MSACNGSVSPVAEVTASLKRGFKDVDVATGGVGVTRLADLPRLKRDSEERLNDEFDFDRDF